MHVLNAYVMVVIFLCAGGFFFFQAEDGIRDLVRSRGLGDVYKRQTTSGGTALAGTAGRPAGALTLASADTLTATTLTALSLIHI